MSGYFEIGIYNTKTEANVGTLWRSAYQLGAIGIFTIGKRYKHESSDTGKAWRQIPLRHYLTIDEMLENRPSESLIVGIEMGGISLVDFKHPKQVIYLLGAEDHGLPENVIKKCNSIISIDSIRTNSFNVAVAGSIVMWDRFNKQIKNREANDPL